MYADLHIHGRYSRATSQRMNVNELVHYSLIKGLNLIGTGDFTHPEWMKELRNSLGEILGTGLYKPTGQTNRQIYFMITSEVCTIFNYNDRIKKMGIDLIIVNKLILGFSIFSELGWYKGLYKSLYNKC